MFNYGRWSPRLRASLRYREDYKSKWGTNEGTLLATSMLVQLGPLRAIIGKRSLGPPGSRISVGEPSPVKERGSPLGSYPYGNQPQKEAEVAQGIDYIEMGCD